MNSEEVRELRTLAIVGGCHVNGETTGKIKSKGFSHGVRKKPEFESPLEHQKKQTTVVLSAFSSNK